jgi:hypothetical protein
MAEERTVSNITWLTPALRSALDIETVVSLVQLQQYFHTQRQKRKVRFQPLSFAVMYR